MVRKRISERRKIRHNAKYDPNAETVEVGIKSTPEIVAYRIDHDIQNGSCGYAFSTYERELGRFLSAESNADLVLTIAKPFAQDFILNQDLNCEETKLRVICYSV